MKRFEFWLRLELFERIKLMAKFYNKPISKIMIELLEIGYITKLKYDSYKDKDFSNE